MIKLSYKFLFLLLFLHSNILLSQKYTANVPEIEYTELDDYYSVGQEVQCTARVYSYGLVDDLCAIYYKVFKDDFTTPISSIEEYGHAEFAVRGQGENYVTQTISSGSGYISVKPMFTTYIAFTLGIFDNWCVNRNRPIVLSMNFTEPGLYKFKVEIQKCSNSGSSILTSFQSNGNEYCSTAGTSHSDKVTSSCTSPETLFTSEIIIPVCSESEITFLEGETEYCSGDELFLTYRLGDNDNMIDQLSLPDWISVTFDEIAKTASLSGIIPDYDAENPIIEFDVKSMNSSNPDICPSAVINQSITILPSESSIQNVAICQGGSYTFFDQEFSEAGTHEVAVENSNGCYDKHYLNLTVNPIYNNSTHIQLCVGSSYEFAGATYTENTNIAHTFETVYGCDSVVNLNLEFVEQFETNLKDTICEGEYYLFGDEEIFETGEYTLELSSAQSCDSIVILNLIVNPTNEIILNETINEGETFVFNNQELTETGEYVSHLINEFGCDSTVTLNLTVVTQVFTNEILYNQISVFPNPTNSILYINIGNVDENIKADIFISITDIAGKEIINKQRYVGNLDLSTFKSGIYFLNIYLKNSKLTTKLIMKK